MLDKLKHKIPLSSLMFIPDELFGCGLLEATDLTNERSFSHQLSRGKRSAVVSCTCGKPKDRPFTMTMRFHLPAFLNESVWDRHALSRADVVQCLMAYSCWHLWSLILIENGHIANPALKSSRASTDSFIPGGKVLALKRIRGFIDKAKPSSDGDAQAVACTSCKFAPGLKTRPLTCNVMNRPGDEHIPKLPTHHVSRETFERMQRGLVVSQVELEHRLSTDIVFTWGGISFVALKQEAYLDKVYILCSRVVRLSEYTSALSGRLKYRMKPVLVTFELEPLAILEESFWVEVLEPNHNQHSFSPQLAAAGDINSKNGGGDDGESPESPTSPRSPRSPMILEAPADVMDTEEIVARDLESTGGAGSVESVRGVAGVAEETRQVEDNFRELALTEPERMDTGVVETAEKTERELTQAPGGLEVQEVHEEQAVEGVEEVSGVEAVEGVYQTVEVAEKVPTVVETQLESVVKPTQTLIQSKDQVFIQDYVKPASAWSLFLRPDTLTHKHRNKAKKRKVLR